MPTREDAEESRPRERERLSVLSPTDEQASFFRRPRPRRTSTIGGERESLAYIPIRHIYVRGANLRSFRSLRDFFLIEKILIFYRRLSLSLGSNRTLFLLLFLDFALKGLNYLTLKATFKATSRVQNLNSVTSNANAHHTRRRD